MQGIQQQAQAMAQQPPQGAMSPMGHSMAPQMPSMPQQGNQGLPPPQILIQLAQQAKALDPMMLGALVYHALKQGGQPLTPQGMQAIA